MKGLKRYLGLMLAIVFVISNMAVAGVSAATITLKAMDLSDTVTSYTIGQTQEIAVSLVSASEDGTTNVKTDVTGSEHLTYVSSDEEIFTVAADGKATARGYGYSTITVNYDDGTTQASGTLMLYCLKEVSNPTHSNVVSAADPLTGEEDACVSVTKKGGQYLASDGTNGRTFMSAWFYEENVNAYRTYFNLQGDGNTNKRLLSWIKSSSDTNYGYWRMSTTKNNDLKSINHDKGWHQFSAVWDSNGDGTYAVTFFVDGVKVASEPLSTVLHLIYLGAETGSAVTHYFKNVQRGTYAKSGFSLDSDVAGSVNASTTVQPELSFSNAFMLASGKTYNDAVTVTDSEGTAVPFTVVASGKVLTLTFDNELKISESYTISVNDNLTDVYGLTLPDEDKVITFTTKDVKTSDIVGAGYKLIKEIPVDMTTSSITGEGTTQNKLIAGSGSHQIGIATGDYTSDRIIIRFKANVADFTKMGVFGQINMINTASSTKEMNYTYATGNDANGGLRFPYRTTAGQVNDYTTARLFKFGEYDDFENQDLIVTYEIDIDRADNTYTNSVTQLTIENAAGDKRVSNESYPWSGYNFKDLKNINFKGSGFTVEDMTVYALEKIVPNAEFIQGTVTSADKADGGVTLTVPYTLTNNKLDDSQEYVVTVAAFTKDNKLVGVGNSTGTVAKGASTADTSVTLDVNVDADTEYSLYAFVWKSYDTMYPIMEKIEITK